MNLPITLETRITLGCPIGKLEKGLITKYKRKLVSLLKKAGYKATREGKSISLTNALNYHEATSEFILYYTALSVNETFVINDMNNYLEGYHIVISK